jgi:hypothetical protein
MWEARNHANQQEDFYVRANFRGKSKAAENNRTGNGVVAATPITPITPASCRAESMPIVEKMPLKSVREMGTGWVWRQGPREKKV